MASTTSITRAPKGETPAPNPTTINPLVQTGHSALTDTINHVDAMLTFMSSAFLHADQAGNGINLSSSACWGAALVLDTCRAALTYHLDSNQEGGAQ